MRQGHICFIPALAGRPTALLNRRRGMLITSTL